MRRIHVQAWLLAVAASWPACAADAPFHFDPRQAIELAVGQIRSEIDRHPQAAVPGVDFEHPRLAAVRAHSNRRFVFVSFDSALAKWGAYTILEVCDRPARLVPNGVGKVIDIEVFREVVSRIGPATTLALPSVCS